MISGIRARGAGRVAHKSGEQFATAAYVEVAVKGGDVDVHGVTAQLKPDGDLLFAVAGKEPFESLEMSRTQTGNRPGGRLREFTPQQLAELGDNFSLYATASEGGLGSE